MRFVDKKQKLDYLLNLVIAGNGGTAIDLSANLCVSYSTLKRYLNDLRELGYNIGYCTFRKTYYLIDKE